MTTAAKGTPLVTGASSGIGAIYADRREQRGYDLILVASRRREPDDAFSRVCGARVGRGAPHRRWKALSQILPPFSLPATVEKDRDMSLIRRIGTLRTLSFAVGVMLGLVSAGYAQSGTDAQFPARQPGPQPALDQEPIVAGHRRQPTAEEIDRRRGGTVPSTSRFPNEDRELQQLYDEIMRRTEPAPRY